MFCGTATRHAISLPSLILEAAVETLLSAGESSSLPLPILVVPDLRQDDRFKLLPVVAVENGPGSCIGIPIKSYSGAFIGIYCLLADQPRASTALSDVDIDFLQDMSHTIMDYLDFTRSRREFDRSTRMVRGIGSFVENKTTMYGLAKASRRRSSSEGERGRGREGVLNALQQESQSKMEKQYQPQHPSPPVSGEQSSEFGITAKDWGNPSPELPSPNESSTKRLSKGSVVQSWLGQSPDDHPSPDDKKTRHDEKPMPANESATQIATTSPPPAPPNDLQQLFSRAANIIREAIEVEGVLFFDASVGYWGGLIEPSGRNSSHGSTSTNSTTSSSGDDDALPTRSTIRTQTDEGACDVFGFSMTDSSSIDGQKASSGHLNVPERFLRILLRRYPMGKIFNFTADGKHVSDTETDEDITNEPAQGQEAPPRIRRKKFNSYSRVNEAALIIQVFPGARSVLAFPLWDSHRERWFAGGVVWTRTPTRVFSIEGELSYLRAFGMVAMAEVARMDAEVANKSKTTLLSSISHELRSPLHGILGGVEIMQNTGMDVFQSNVIHTVETCGVMLLDTIDHLLTQSEINQSVRTARLRRRERRQLPRNNSDRQSPALEVLAEIEVDAIIEQVVESMVAGYEFMHLSRPLPKQKEEDVSSSQLKPVEAAIERASSPNPIEESVKVILDIQAAPNWAFSLEAGALRRVVMNIFGNSLKYTTSGSIKLAVSQRELSKKRNSHLSEIEITVEDTGKGIGEEYLANHLFKPFSQEDALSQGTGLGLSITHQIVASLHGKIDVQSVVGQGTIMSIFLRLTRTPPTEDSTPINPKFVAQTKQTKGLRVSLFGFHDEADDNPNEPPSFDRNWQLPRASIKRLCEDWLHMDVLADVESFIRPDIYIATQAGAQKLVAMNKSGTVIQPVVVICPSATIAQNVTKVSKTRDEFGVFEYISQP
jgi:signal transduction histidine kinase